jgi:hypothetical protein
MLSALYGSVFRPQRTVHFYPRGKQEYGEERNIIDKQKKDKKKRRSALNICRYGHYRPNHTTTLMQHTRRFN